MQSVFSLSEAYPGGTVTTMLPDKSVYNVLHSLGAGHAFSFSVGSLWERITDAGINAALEVLDRAR